MKTPLFAVSAAALVLLGGCASVPTGPSVMALPGSNRTYDQFRDDDMQCRQYAAQQIGSPDNDAAVRSAVVGTLIGAAAGAAIGGDHQGAGIGAGTGLLVGSMAGADTTQTRGYGSQRQYDNVYIQCMYGKGHRVPVAGSMTGRRLPAQTPVQTETGADYPPPPPPSYPPPDSIPPDYQDPR
jgi:hypothetical protein